MSLQSTSPHDPLHASDKDQKIEKVEEIIIAKSIEGSFQAKRSKNEKWIDPHLSLVPAAFLFQCKWSIFFCECDSYVLCND